MESITLKLDIKETICVTFCLIDKPFKINVEANKGTSISLVIDELRKQGYLTYEWQYGLFFADDINLLRAKGITNFTNISFTASWHTSGGVSKLGFTHDEFCDTYCSYKGKTIDRLVGDSIFVVPIKKTNKKLYVKFIHPINNSDIDLRISENILLFDVFSLLIGYGFLHPEGDYVGTLKPFGEKKESIPLNNHETIGFNGVGNNNTIQVNIGNYRRCPKLYNSEFALHEILAENVITR